MRKESNERYAGSIPSQLATTNRVIRKLRLYLATHPSQPIVEANLQTAEKRKRRIVNELNERDGSLKP